MASLFITVLWLKIPNMAGIHISYVGGYWTNVICLFDPLLIVLSASTVLQPVLDERAISELSHDLIPELLAFFLQSLT